LSCVVSMALTAHAGEAVTDIEAEDSTGVTPLLRSISDCNLTRTNWLLANGANPNHCLAAGQSPLMHCAQFDDIYALRSLLQKGADVNYVGEGGVTALMKAAAFAGDDFVSLLLEHGADIDAGDGAVLWNALSKNRYETARMLLARGARPNIARGGLPILSVVVAYLADETAVKLLRRYGARVDLPATSGEYQGKTALQIADDKHQPLMVAALTAPLDTMTQYVNIPIPVEGGQITKMSSGRIRKLEGHRIQFETGIGADTSVIVLRFDATTAFRRKKGEVMVEAANPDEFVGMPEVTIEQPLNRNRLIAVREGPLTFGSDNGLAR
jgi:hypothetical protein